LNAEGSSSAKNGIYGAGNGWEEKEQNYPIEYVANGTEAIKDRNGDFGFQAGDKAQSYTLQIYVKSDDSGGGGSSESGGGESGDTDGYITSNTKLNQNIDLGNLSNGTVINMNLKKDSGTNGNFYQVAVGGTPTDGKPWTGYDASGTLDNNGEATVTITVLKDINGAQIQLWNYESGTTWNTGSVDKSTLTLVSYKITPPSSSTNGVVQTQSRTLMSRFSSRTLRKGAAQDYTALPLAVPQITNQTSGTPVVLAASPESAAQTVFTSNGTIDVTLSDLDGWVKTIAGLPKYTYVNGVATPYYYWVEEINSPNYKASYSFTDGDSETDYSINAANPGANPLITIKNTPTESPSVELPESGSTGTKIYYLTGGILLLLSAAGYITYTKRRRWFNE